jgi:hypothetical protein
MLEAEKVFIAAIRKEYTVWACEQVAEKEVDLKEWMEKNP